MSDPQFNPTVRNSPRKSSGIGAMVFMILFATPFAGFGLVALFQGIKKTIAEETGNGLMLSLFGLIFSTIGFGLMFGAVWGRKKTLQADELQARFPDKPWLARADWAAGKIKSSDMAQVKIFAFVAFAFCAVGALYTFEALPKELHNGNYKALIVLIFPAIGIGFLIAVVRAFRAHRRFGDCFFELAQIPAPLGGTLEGMIQTGAQLKLEHGLHLKISCVRRTVSGSGKNESVTEAILWQDEKILASNADLPEPEPGHTGIPVHFKLPGNQPECYARGRESVFWRLDAKAKMSGPSFHAAFDVPVFKVAGAITETADEPDPTAAMQAPIEEIRREENSRIKISDGPDGREFYFPAARNIGTALFMTLFMLVFNGFAAAMFHFHAPILFPIVFGLIGILLIFGTFSVWFKSSRVTIDSTTVRATTRWLVFSRTRQFSANDVARFATKTGMQSGSQVFTDIKLIPRGSDDTFAARKERFRDAKTSDADMVMARYREAAGPSGVTVASSIANVAEANWLVQEMNKALGRK
jgi:hypothetical protein